MTMSNNISSIISALQALDDDLKWRDSVDTPFGKQSPVYGYTVDNIHQSERRTTVTIGMLDRMQHEADDCTRGGDGAIFRIEDGRVFSDEEWEQRCKMAEKVYKFTDADRLASLTASETERFVDVNGYDLTFTVAPLGIENGKQMYSVTASLYQDYDSDDSVMLQKESFTVDAFGLFSEVNESVVNGDMSNQYFKESLEHKKEFVQQTENTIRSLVHSLQENAGQEQYPSARTIMEDRHGFLVSLELSEDESGYTLRADCHLDSKRTNVKNWELSSSEQVTETLKTISEGFITSHYLLESENEALKNRMAKTSYERGE